MHCIYSFVLAEKTLEILHFTCTNSFCLARRFFCQYGSPLYDENVIIINNNGPRTRQILHHWVAFFYFFLYFIIFFLFLFWCWNIYNQRVIVYETTTGGMEKKYRNRHTQHTHSIFLSCRVNTQGVYIIINIVSLETTTLNLILSQSAYSIYWRWWCIHTKNTRNDALKLH